MRRLRRFVTRLTAVALRRDLDDRFREELEQHIAMQTADNVRAGMPAGEARRQAVLKFGSVESVAERYRDERRLSLLDEVTQDVRYGLRQLRKAPVFALTATLTLALGIGVNTTMFTVVYGVLLRDLPYPEPDRLMRLVQAHSGSDLTMAEVEVLRDGTRAFSSVAAYRGSGQRRIGRPEDHNWISTIVVSADFLRTLGVQPQIGREFIAEETRPGGVSAVILSDHVWRNGFGADPGILGRTITLDDSTAAVVGVLPAGFWFPQPVDAVLPLQPTGALSDTGTNTQVIARLAPGVGPAEAQAELTAMTERMREAARDSLPQTYRGLSALSYRDWLVGDVQTNLLLLFGATGVLLLIACGNLALLLLARFASRAKEVAVRTALGSSRRRMLSQFLAENILLTAIGAAAGVFAAYSLVRVLVALMPFDLPASSPIAINGIVLAFTIATALATALFVTVLPFLNSRVVNVPMSLRGDGRSAGAAAMRSRARTLFIVGEVALSTTLLVAAGLLFQTMYRTTQEQLGFVPEGVLTFATPLAPERAKNADDRSTFTRALLERLRHTPGVDAAAAANLLPLSGQSNLPTQRDGHPEHSIGGMEVRAVTADYFRVMGMPIRQGRSISGADLDGAAAVVVVSESVARSWWDHASGIGDRLTIGRYQGKQLMNDVSREVIGIVGDTKAVRLQAPPRPTVYVPMGSGVGSSSITWVVKTSGGRDLARQIRAAVSTVDPGQRITQMRMMDEIVAAASAVPRFNASLFGMFAGVALALTLVGLYGVLSFVVAQRQQEIGTRMALGASRADVLRGFVRQGLALTAIGSAIGLAAALVVSRWLAALLFGVEPHDPWSFAGVAVTVLLTGILASYMPARRAASIDPLIAMRGD